MSNRKWPGMMNLIENRYFAISLSKREIIILTFNGFLLFQYKTRVLGCAYILHTVFFFIHLRLYYFEFYTRCDENTQ